MTGPTPEDFWRNVRHADQGTVRTALQVVRNLGRRLRGRPCCGHPGEPGC
ncbi:MAG TPA: hypothetical protein VF880_07920 [Actinomycetes bacterium]